VSTILSDREQALVDRLLKSASDLKRVLDVGCGEGKILKYLQAKDIDVFGVDSHEPTIEQLKKDGIPADVLNARKLPFEDDHFDWVILSGVLHHIPNPGEAIDEAIRVAKQGVIMSEPWFDETVKSHRLAAEVDAWAKKLHQSLGFFHRKGLSSGEIIGSIGSTDVKNIAVVYESFYTPEDLDVWFKNQEQYYSQLPEDHVIAWEGRVLRERMKDQFVCEPGWVIVTLFL